MAKLSNQTRRTATADLAVAVVFAVSALVARDRYDYEDFVGPLQFVLWTFAIAAAVRAVVRLFESEIYRTDGD